MWKKWALLSFAAMGLSACGMQSDDNYGVYADGEFYFVANYSQHKINFTSDAHPGPDILLGEIEQGKGIGFTTWRDKASCGMADEKGNSFVIPRKVPIVTRNNITYMVTPQPAVFRAADNGQNPHSVFVTVKTAQGVPYRYLYDDTVGIRFIDRNNQDGSFDRRIFLEQGVGLLAHCRGFSLDDYQN